MKTRSYVILSLVLAALVIGSLYIGAQRGDLEGADGKAEEAIIELDPDYEPWMDNLWEIPSGEVESAIFAIQAGIGGIVIGYVIGVMKGAKNNNKSV